MSGVWRKTLVYLGLVEEPEEHDDLPQRFDEPRRVEQPVGRGGGETSRHQSPQRSEPDRESGEGTVRPLRFPAQGESSARSTAERAGGGGGPEGARARGGSGGARRGDGREQDGSTSRGMLGFDSNTAGGGIQRVGTREDGGGGRRAGTRVRVVEVHAFDDCEGIGRAYRAGHPVLFDLGEVQTAVGRRVLDFVSGITFGLRGSLDKAGERAFLLVPEGVRIPDDEHRRLEELGFRSRS